MLTISGYTQRVVLYKNLEGWFIAMVVVVFTCRNGMCSSGFSADTVLLSK